MPTPSSSSGNSVLQTLREIERKLDAPHEGQATSHSGGHGLEHQPAFRVAPTLPDKAGSTKAPDRSFEVGPAKPDTSSLPGPIEAKSTKVDQAFEQYKQVNEDKPDESPYVIRQARTKRDDVMTNDAHKSPATVEIENMMADGLTEVYLKMTPDQQQKFKVKGEEVAKEITSMTESFKIKARRVLKLLREWLHMIPGINRFFLEQEAKLKTDELLKYARKYSREHHQE